LRGLEYAFRQTAWEHGFTKNQFHTFVQAYITQDNIAPLWLLDQCDQPKSGKAFFSMRRCGELYGFYNNFFISKVSFWHKPEVQRFLDHIDREGVIYTLRWNDILWQSTAVQMFMPRRQVHMFDDFTYEHATRFYFPDKTSCIIYGGLATGINDKNGACSRPLEYLREFCNAVPPRNRAYLHSMGFGTQSREPCMQAVVRPDGGLAVSISAGAVSVTTPPAFMTSNSMRRVATCIDTLGASSARGYEQMRLEGGVPPFQHEVGCLLEGSPKESPQARSKRRRDLMTQCRASACVQQCPDPLLCPNGSGTVRAVAPRPNVGCPKGNEQRKCRQRVKLARADISIEDVPPALPAPGSAPPSQYGTIAELMAAAGIKAEVASRYVEALEAQGYDAVADFRGALQRDPTGATLSAELKAVGILPGHANKIANALAA